MLLEMKDAVKQFGGIIALSHMSFRSKKGKFSASSDQMVQGRLLYST